MTNFQSGNPTRARGGSLLAASVAVSLLVAAGSAHAAIALVTVPNDLAGTEGELDNSIPFGDDVNCDEGIRYQLLLPGDQVGSGNIGSLAFRQDASEDTEMDPFTYNDVRVAFSSTDRTPSTMSDTFAENVGPDETVVFSGDLTAGAGVNASPPHPFDFEIPVEAAFNFDGSSDNLLVDITMGGCFDRPGEFRAFDSTADGLARRAAPGRDADVATTMGNRGLVTQLTVSTAPPTPVFYDCPLAGGGDNLTRGFYLEDFPSDRLDVVRLTYYPDTPGDYEIRLTARQGSYDGPLIGTDTVTVEAGSEADVVSEHYYFRGAGVPPGSTIAFSQELLDQPEGSRIFYDHGPCPLGAECGDCPGVVQTAGTEAPLDSFRRGSVGVKVTPGPAVPGGPVTGLAGLGGNWTVVGHDGEGFMVDVTRDGQLVVIWFTYDELGNQMWLIGVADDFDGESATMTLQRLTGPSFGPDFDPGDRMDEDLGTLEISFDDCDNGGVNYDLGAFGSGSYDIARIYQTEQGLCP